jgi:CMP-N-acetylneuraminic acid synthetase
MKSVNMKIVALILARIGSRRLKRKNIRLVNGKPMISYAINSCKKSKLIDEVYVSTESKTIAEIVKKYDVKIINRPKKLARDNVRSQDVFQHFAKVVKDFDVLVSVQVNSPNVKTKNIDKAIKKLIDNNLWEVKSVNSDGIQNGAIWVLKRDTIFWRGLSVYMGVVTDDSVDIHTIEDLKRAERLMKHGRN